MHWNKRMRYALTKTTTLHDGMYRKGLKHEPVVAHLVSVAMQVAAVTDNEDAIIAALLHDSIEDTPYTPEELTADFGERVCSFVLGVTIPGMRDGVENGAWEPDRHAYVQNLRTAPIESCCIAAADKIDNFRSVVIDFADDVADFKKQFSGTKKGRLMVYGAITQVLSDRLGENHPLIQNLLPAWDEYRAFVEATL
jgi:(p)ppGpp synthase/HD superfamily hydrolase